MDSFVYRTMRCIVLLITLAVIAGQALADEDNGGNFSRGGAVDPITGTIYISTRSLFQFTAQPDKPGAVWAFHSEPRCTTNGSVTCDSDAECSGCVGGLCSNNSALGCNAVDDCYQGCNAQGRCAADTQYVCASDEDCRDCLLREGESVRTCADDPGMTCTSSADCSRCTPVKWIFPSTKAFFSPPAIAPTGACGARTVYVGGDDEYFYALDPEPPIGVGTCEYSFYDGSNNLRPCSDPAAPPGCKTARLLHPSCSRWKFNVEDRVRSQAAIDPTTGVVFIGNMAKNATVFAFSHKSGLDTSTGCALGKQCLWRNDDVPKGELRFSPLLSEDGQTLYVGSDAGCSGSGLNKRCGGLHAVSVPPPPPDFDCAGPEIGSFCEESTTGGSSTGTPCEGQADCAMCGASFDCKVPGTKLLWSFDYDPNSTTEQISAEPYPIGATIGPDSTIYVGSDRKVVALVDATDPDGPAPCDICGGVKVCADPSRGQPCLSDDDCQGVGTCRSICAGEGTSDPKCVKWFRQIFVGTYEPFTRSRPVVSLDGSTVFALSRQAAHLYSFPVSGMDEGISSFDPCDRTGYSIPTIHPGRDASDPLKGSLFFSDTSGYVYALDMPLTNSTSCSLNLPDGHWVSRVGTDELRSTVLLSSDGELAYIGSKPGLFRAVDVDDGSLQWCFDTRAQPVGELVALADCGP